METLALQAPKVKAPAAFSDGGPAFGDIVAPKRSPIEGVAAAVQFLREFDPDGWHNLVRLDPTKCRAFPIAVTIPPGRWDLVENFVSEFAGRENLYFTPNEPAPGSPDKKLLNANIARIRAVYADVDLPAGNEEAAVAGLRQEIEKKLAGLPGPSHLVDTGGGMQMHWRLTEKLPAAEGAQWATDQARGLADHFNGDRVIDISRMMRLPGVPNIPTPEKAAKGRRERMATIIRSSGKAHAPDDLMRAVPPIPRAVGKQLADDAAIAALEAQFEAAWSDLATAGTLDDLPRDLRDRFAAAREANDRLRRLWEGDPPESGDASGSGYRAALAAALGKARNFGAEDFAALALVWDFAVQLGDDRDAKLTSRALARDWMNCGYLRYDDNRTVDAVRTVTNAPQPERAARDLLDMAGRTPETMQNARAAFWRLLKDEGQASQRDLRGARPWQGRYLSDFLADPKNDAVARVLYEDRPQELADMRQVFDALAGADPTTRAKLPNSSGTAQALSGKFDPALSASSISSRLRSVNRGQLSPSIAIIDVAATFLRRRSAQMQAGAIGRLQDEVIQNPALAAQLLEEYNPATFAAKRRMILQRYGVRATQVVNLMDEIHAEELGEDDTVRAVMSR